MSVARRRIPVVVVLPPRTLLLDVAGPVEVLRTANDVQDRVTFDVTYVSPSRDVSTSIGLTVTGLAALPVRIEDDAVVMIAGAVTRTIGSASGQDADAKHVIAIVDWLRRSIRPGHLLISICEGAMLAGRAGLLDGYECTTHYACCARLAEAAPLARVLENRLFVEDGERLTSAGVTAGVDLALHLVARWVGHATALAVARRMVVYLRRGPDDPQLSPWLEGRNHLHPAVHRAQDAIAADPSRDWSLTDLARVAHASPRHLSRLFSAHASMTVTDAINRARVALARDMLAQTRLDMERVAERAGFGSARQMRRVWRRFYSTPPVQARAT